MAPFLAARIDIQIVPGTTEMTRPTQRIPFGMHTNIFMKSDDVSFNAIALLSMPCAAAHHEFLL
jgi:hypothetical protein